ncbi:MAG: HD domain-containing protein [Bacteroidales bacterium]|nr:HD domain-containing protein [Bacteroidales bacterium]
MELCLDKKNVSDLKKWFLNYIETFRYEDPDLQQNIDIKRKHTERVAEEIVNIGKKLGLSDGELNLAEIIAIFHDIGRFEQYYRYRTFSDHKSEDHAELGIKILKDNKVLDFAGREIRELILTAIRYHNRALLPVNETKTHLFYSRLIRDADKLDIWRVVTDYYRSPNHERNSALELELPDDTGISKDVIESLMNKQIVNTKHIRNLNDMKLLQAGWIFDINFKPTIEFIKERRYMDLMRDVLPQTGEITAIFNIIGLHLKNYNGTNY